MIASLKVLVANDVTEIYTAPVDARLTLRVQYSSAVRIGNKEVSVANGFFLPANTCVGIELKKGDTLYGITSDGIKCVDVLVQGDN